MDVVTREMWITVRTFIRWLGILGLGYLLSTVVIHLADQNLIKVGVIINSILHFSGNVYISYSIAISFGIWGTVERLLRRKQIKVFSERIDNLERADWPEKESSLLRKDGTTRKEDK